MSDSAIWLALLIFFVLIEVASFQLIAIWFALAALCTLLVSFVISNIVVQSFIFFGFAAIFLVLCYPLLKRIYRPRSDTNSDRVVGQPAVVTQRIEPALAKGQVKVDGKEWSVKVKNIEQPCIEVGTVVMVKGIEGVKLVIEPMVLRSED
jgi:membrane protein implicated in regulation of membrane protease activity